ncbi:MAG: phosphate/phosphite/phosphonate ABC transporter substrate-binding protein [Sulfuricella sp.]
MKRASRLLFWFAALFALLPMRLAAEPQALEIAIFPYLSTRTLLTRYQPLQTYLEKKLQRPVLLVTAPDFRTFVERTQRGEYRYVLTAPHFARLAQKEAGYQPMLMAKENLVAIAVVEKNSPLRNVAELRGKTVAVPDPLAIVSMLGAQLLRANGLVPGKDVTLRPALSHNSAVFSVLRGDSAAAFTELATLKQMPEEIKNGVRILATIAEFSNLMYLANPKVPAGEVAQMTAILLEFAEKTPQGRKLYGETLGHQGLVAPSPKELQRLDPFVSELKALLDHPR